MTSFNAHIVVVLVALSLTVTLMMTAVLLPGALAQVAEPVEREVVLYEAPVTTEVIDPFRPPAHIGGAGNRGLEYGDTDNAVVAAAADGTVIFAGPVAGRSVVTIEHRDGVRTTYTGLLEVWVVADMTVPQGSAIALATIGFHFGARIKDHYLDPQILLDASQGTSRPRLIAPPN